PFAALPFFFFSSLGVPRDLHSFPTRRSSDLLVGQIGLCGSAGLVDDFPQLSAAEGLRQAQGKGDDVLHGLDTQVRGHPEGPHVGDRKSTRLNSSHVSISYAVFCLKKKKNRPR